MTAKDASRPSLTTTGDASITQPRNTRPTTAHSDVERGGPSTACCRVLQVTEAAAGGVRRHLQRLIPELCGLGIDIDVLVGTRRPEPGMRADLALYQTLGCWTAEFGGRSTPSCLLRGAWALRRAVARRHPTVVHLHSTRAGLFGRIALLGRSCPPVVYSPHAFAFQGHLPGILQNTALITERLLRRATDALVCVSHSEAGIAQQALGWDADRICVAENGLEPAFRDCLLPREIAREQWHIPPDTVLVGFPGRLAPQKDPRTLLHALSDHREWGGSLKVMFCGTGPLEAPLRVEAERMGLSDIVVWAGHVSDLPERMAAFDLVVMPSRYEGLSYALLEAVAAGVPVIAADIPENAPRDALRGAVTFFPPGDAAALAAAMGDTISHLAQVRERAAGAAEVVFREFSASRQAGTLARLYRGLSCATADSAR